MNHNRFNIRTFRSSPVNIPTRAHTPWWHQHLSFHSLRDVSPPPHPRGGELLQHLATPPHSFFSLVRSEGQIKRPSHSRLPRAISGALKWQLWNVRGGGVNLATNREPLARGCLGEGKTFGVTCYCRCSRSCSSRIQRLKIAALFSLLLLYRTN